MLFAWLFALSASWANACVLQPGFSGDHHELGRVVAPHGGPTHEINAGADESHESDPALQACVSFCDTEQNIVTKAQPTKGDGSAEPSTVVVQVVASWPAFAPGHAEFRWRPLAAPSPPGPPVAIAFLRLTI
jgi:hypothetical protein